MDFERVKQNTIPFCVTLSEELATKLDAKAEQEHTTKARIVRGILNEYFSNLKGKKNGKQSK